MVERWERALLAALAVLLALLALPGPGRIPAEALGEHLAELLPGGVWGLLFPLGRLLRLGLEVLAEI